MVNRVFWIKFQRLIKLIVKELALGENDAFAWVIENQKRGLPHGHCLFIQSKADSDHILNADILNQIVSAEMNFTDEKIYNLVTKYMLHGPCGKLNRSSVCNNAEGVCKNNFPKEFFEKTDSNVDGYPQYRRRDLPEDVFVTKSGVKLDNRWVVPTKEQLSYPDWFQHVVQ